MDPLLRKMPTHVEFGIKLLEMNGHLTPRLCNVLDSSYLLYAISHVHSFINAARRREGRLLLFDFTASEPLLSSLISNSFMLPSLRPRQQADFLSLSLVTFFQSTASPW